MGRAAMNNYPDGIDGRHPYFNPPPEPVCPECGMETELDWRFCPMCGERLESPEEEIRNYKEWRFEE